MSRVAELKAAIEKLTPIEREELEAMIWPAWDRSTGDSPPGIRDKLNEAANGEFKSGDRSNIAKILSSLE